MQESLDLQDLRADWVARDRAEVLRDIERLVVMQADGLIGGDTMPEDVHPGLDASSRDNYHYFTLSMALNYQRNSYALWEAATRTYVDATTRAIFDPSAVAGMEESTLREKLLRHGLGLQPVRHVQIWARLCAGISELDHGDIRNMFRRLDRDVERILDELQDKQKTHFPYLSGPKICHYWLYVLEQYTDLKLHNRHLISVAPDTHVIKATQRLGIVEPGSNQDAVAKAWRDLLEGTGICPIDVHTRLWLWSRAGFPAVGR